MTFNCLEGWSNVAKFGNITIESKSVEICDNICDHADLCGIEHCKFYDLSREATRRFQRAQAHEETLEGLLERRAIH